MLNRLFARRSSVLCGVHGTYAAFVGRWCCVAMRGAAKSGLREHFPASRPGRPRQRTNLYEKSLGGPFPTKLPGKPRQRTNLYEKWPLGAISQQIGQEAPPAYKSIRKEASGGPFPASRPERPRQRTNLYGKWPPGAISEQVAQGGPASVQIDTKVAF